MSTELTPVPISLAGITPAGAAVDDAGNWFTNPGGCFVHILGGGVGGGILKVTIDSKTACNYGSDHNIEKIPAAATVYLLGPIPKSRFDDNDGKVQITFAAGCFADNMKIQIIKLP